jgi:O-antigen ligase
MAIAALCGLRLWTTIGSIPGDIARSGTWLASGYALLLITDFANGGGIANLLQTGVNYLPLLAVAPLALAIRLADVTPALIDRALQVTILMALIFSVLLWIAGDPRPGGLNLNPIPYGFAILLSATLLLWRGISGNQRLSFTLSLLAAVPILLTGSKIVWVCALLSYAIGISYWILKNRFWAYILPVTAATLSCLAVFYFAYANSRLEYLRQELHDLSTSGVSMGGSLGARIEIIVSAWRAFLQKPLIGYGLDERMSATFAHLTPSGPDVTNLGHLHNDYVTHLVSYGMFGGIFIVVFLAGFWRQSSLSAIFEYKSAGMVYVILLAIYMSAEVAFNMDPVSGPMAVFLALLIASRAIPIGNSKDSAPIMHGSKIN